MSALRLPPVVLRQSGRPLPLPAVIRQKQGNYREEITFDACAGVRKNHRSHVAKYEKQKALRRIARLFVSGGGGNRTRVPRRFRESFYVRVRFFEVRRWDPQPTGSPTGYSATEFSR